MPPINNPSLFRLINPFLEYIVAEVRNAGDRLKTV